MATWATTLGSLNNTVGGAVIIGHINLGIKAKWCSVYSRAPKVSFFPPQFSSKQALFPEHWPLNLLPTVKMDDNSFALYSPLYLSSAPPTAVCLLWVSDLLKIYICLFLKEPKKKHYPLCRDNKFQEMTALLNFIDTGQHTWMILPNISIKEKIIPQKKGLKCESSVCVHSCKRKTRIKIIRGSLLRSSSMNFNRTRL